MKKLKGINNDFISNEPPTLVWYHIERDEIFISHNLEAYFFSLAKGIYWDKVELLGEL